MNLNGFEIDKFNQYNLPENVKQSTCPLCSDQRKKKTDKCLTIDWNRGLAKCWHCNELLQLHTYKHKENQKEYARPEWKNNTKLSDKLVKWFEGRKISQFTLRQMKITEGMEWMPQSQKEENTVQFNYFRNQELVNVKYRTGDKKFKLFKDAEKIFYNYDNCMISSDILIVEGEIDCLSFIEAGVFHCVSVPNGSVKQGQVNLDYLDNCIEIFENKKKVYLALDKDEAGQHTQKEFIRRLGLERCFIVDLNECKDANEYLCKYGTDALKLTIENAKEIPIEGVSSVNDWRGEFEEYLMNGMQKGFQIGIASFDKVFSTYTGQFITVTGVPSCFDSERLIHTDKGVKKISDLKIGDKVYSYNHNKRMNEYKKVLDKSFNKSKLGKMYEIKMKDGTIIKVTGDHLFYTGSEYLQIEKILLSLNKNI